VHPSRSAMTNMLRVFQVNFVRDSALICVDLRHIYVGIRTGVHNGLCVWVSAACL